jgi:hypothetical protein
MEDIKVEVPREAAPAWAQGSPKITAKQRGFILSLLAERNISHVEPARVDSLMKSLRISEDPEEYGMGQRQASKVIEWLLKQPKRDAPSNTIITSQRHADVKPTGLDDGYYAVRGVEGHKNETSFYRLRSPKQGNWVGCQFLDQVVGHGKRYPVKGDARAKIVALINEQGPIECRKLYGQEIGACGRCGRELTDDTSRRFGIGPDCRDILGI